MAQAPSSTLAMQKGAKPGQAGPFVTYDLGTPYDEMFDRAGNPRAGWAGLYNRLCTTDAKSLRDLQANIDRTFMAQGVTFTVYGHEDSTEKIIPTDILPRIVPAHEWDKLERGFKQRVEALNLFLADIYGDQAIIRNGYVPRDLILGSINYRREMLGVEVPHGAYVNVCGTDVIRNEGGDYVVLEEICGCLLGCPTCCQTAMRLSALSLTFTARRVFAPLRPIPMTCWRCSKAWRANINLTQPLLC